MSATKANTASAVGQLRQKLKITDRRSRMMIRSATNVLARYKHLRQIGLELNSRLVESLTRDAVNEGGRKLGILQGDTLILDTEDQAAVLMDYCIHDVRQRGINAVDRYLSESRSFPDSDEWILLQALRQARYTIMLVESVEPGLGVHVRDLFHEESLFLVDVGVSRSASVGMILAGRIMAPEGIAMTTGAVLPVGLLTQAERTRFMDGFAGRDFGSLSPEKAGECAATVIRTCLRRGASNHIQYLEPGAKSRPPQSPRSQSLAPRIGRNDPCRCGSGRKFKRCCGERKSR